MRNFTSYLKIIIFILFINCGLPSAQEKRLYLDNLSFLKSEIKGSSIPLRVSQSIAINNYDLKYHRFFWNIDPAVRYISGSVTSYFVATQDQMSSIQFQLNANLSADSAIFESNTLSINHTGDLITIPFNTTIPFGKLDSITVFYHGIPGVSGFGSFANFVHNDAPSMWTLSEPYGASDWWPTKNDLTDKIDSIDIYVVMPKGNHAASNGILISEIPYGSNSTIAHWKHRYPIASYLVAIAVTNYARYSDFYITGKDSLEILNYVYPEDSAQLRATTSDVIKSIALFEKLFGPYPFRKEKFGHAQCNIGGGMEHQTMTFLGKSSFNHFIFTHELAHQWFGDKVTCGSWEDIWLNEGFATYCLGLSYEFLNTPKDLNNFMNELRGYVSTSSQGSVFCNDTTSVSRIFSSNLTYNKGAILLNMLRWVVGDNNFFQALRDYLNDPALKYGFARTSDLKRHMENQSGKDLTRFFDDWYYGIGMPNYSIQVIQQLNLNTIVTINQTQFNSNVSFYNMVLPIEFKGAGKDTVMTFDNTSSGQIFEFNPGFRIDSVFFDPGNKIIYNQSEVILNHVTEDKIIIMSKPARDILDVLHKSGTINYFQIFDLQGKALFTKLTKQEDTLLELNIQNLQAGMYILKVGTTEWTETRKFIVVK
jgi:hypothetical protein